MPELPEVEHLRRSLLPALVGSRVVSARLHRRDILERGDARSWRRLEGAAILEVRRHGKQLLIATEGPALTVQLGMTGMLLVTAPDQPARGHLHATLTLAARGGGAHELRYHDARRFGCLALYANETEAASQRWSRLGPDALGLTPADLGPRLAGRRAPLKAALLDQGTVAGLGNIYVDEALFLARLSPLRVAGSLRPAEVDRLVEACVGTLRRAIDAGGSTIRDYVDACGMTGGFVASHAVYGRAGQPCRACGAALRQAVVGGRTTVFCGRCQPRGRRAAPGRMRLRER